MTDTRDRRLHHVRAASSTAANRIFYYLDLHGPSMAVDTACSSSLVALDQACRAVDIPPLELVRGGGTVADIAELVHLRLG